MNEVQQPELKEINLGKPQYSFSSTKEDTNYDKLITDNFPNILPDKLIKGEIVNINKDFITVDIGFKSLGQIPYSEFLTTDGSFNYEVGDTVETYLEYLENLNGQVVLSKDKANQLRVWEDVKNIYDLGETIKGVISAKIKGGLSVDIGIKAFLPGSQIDLRPLKDIDSIIGEQFEFKILKYDTKRSNVVLSRRALLEVDREGRRKELLETMKVGAKISGHVKNVTDYGLFIDMGGIDGLLHITDMTWGRISHPSELYQVGDEIEVIVLSFDHESQKVSLGLKQHNEDPWKNIKEKYKVGNKVKGKAVNLTNYGAFLEISEGIEGLLHISEMSWTKKIKSPTSVLNLGDEIDAVIKEIDFERKRISLSMRDLQTNPWQEISDKFPIGSDIEGIIRNITEFGIFVEIEDGIDGLVHTSDVSWSQRHKNKITELYEKNQKINVKLLNVDIAKGRLSLGIKQLTEDPWKDIDKELHSGDEVHGKIVHVADFGVFVELKEGLEGLIHLSEIGRETTKKQMIDMFPLQTTIPMKVLKIDVNEKRLALSPISEELIIKEEETHTAKKKTNDKGSEKIANVEAKESSKEEEKNNISDNEVKSVENIDKDETSTKTTKKKDKSAENTILEEAKIKNVSKESVNEI